MSRLGVSSTRYSLVVLKITNAHFLQLERESFELFLHCAFRPSQTVPVCFGIVLIAAKRSLNRPDQVRCDPMLSRAFTNEDPEVSEEEDKSRAEDRHRDCIF